MKHHRLCLQKAHILGWKSHMLTSALAVSWSVPSKGSCYGVLGNGNVFFTHLHFLTRLSCCGKIYIFPVVFQPQLRVSKIPGPFTCFPAPAAPELAAVSTGDGSRSQTPVVPAAASPGSSYEVFSCLPGSWAASSLRLRPQAPVSPLRIGNLVWNQHRTVLSGQSWSLSDLAHPQPFPPRVAVSEAVTQAAVAWCESWEMPGSIWRCPGISILFS